jgi:hypothetical protein
VQFDACVLSQYFSQFSIFLSKGTVDQTEVVKLWRPAWAPTNLASANR